MWSIGKVSRWEKWGENGEEIQVERTTAGCHKGQSDRTWDYFRWIDLEHRDMCSMTKEGVFAQKKEEEEECERLSLLPPGIFKATCKKCEAVPYCKGKMVKVQTSLLKRTVNRCQCQRKED